MKIAVCVITYQRPKGLGRLLTALNQLTFRQLEPPELQVIVVDNDINQSAEGVVSCIVSEFKWKLVYYVEPDRGISYARNKAVACVPDDTDFVAFIDDDEVPAPSWLESLLLVQHTYGADVVSGPVIPYFPVEHPVPDWIVAGKFFDRPRYATGTQRRVAYTHNALVRRTILQTMGRPFDERFAFSGGEDSHFFSRVYRSGYKIIWSDEAIVHEWIPKSRMNVKWLLKRAYRSYGTVSLCEKEFDPSVTTRLITVIKGSGRILLGVLLIFPALFLGKHIVVKSLLQISRGMGRLAGLAGKRYAEYNTVHGT